MNARFIAAAFSAALIGAGTQQAPAAQVDFHVRGQISWNASGTQSSGSGGGAGRTTGARMQGRALTLPGKTLVVQQLAGHPALTDCADLTVGFKMSDGSVHTTHASGDATKGICTYDVAVPLTIRRPVGNNNVTTTQDNGQTPATSILIGLLIVGKGAPPIEFSAATIGWGDKSGAVSLNFTAPPLAH